MFGSVARMTEREIFPSGVNREFGYWRGSENKKIVNKFNKLYMPLEGSGLYSGSPVVKAKKDTGSNASGLSCDPEGCAWMFDGSDWSLYEDLCGSRPSAYDATCGCTEPPEGGGFMGDIKSTACVGGVGGGGGSTADGDSAGDGFAVWQRAGDLVDIIGQEAIQERCLFLSQRANVNLGSGVSLANAKGFTVYSKILPSGDISDTIILAQHKENPAKFVLGCDFDGRFYIRADGNIEGANTAFTAKSAKSYQEYKYPAHVVGVFASGDSKLKIYVNGINEGESQVFKRDLSGADNTDIILGKRGFAISERGYTGWVDEVGISSKSFSDEEVSKFYNSTFGVTDIIKSYSPPTGAAFDAGLFAADFDAKDKDFIEFTVSSGNSEGALGGAFDPNLWGNSNYAVSSVLSIRIEEAPPNFHQLDTVAVDVWVENATNHPSGAKFTAALVHKDAEKPINTSRSLNWYASGVMIPSGDRQKITFEAPLNGSDTFFPDGAIPFKDDFGKHNLNLTVFYPEYDHPYDAEFKIYSTKIRYTSFDRYLGFNNIDGSILNGASLGLNNGQDFPLFVDGGLKAKASGDLRLTVFADKAAQSMPLVLNQDAKTSMGDTGHGYLTANGAVLINQNMNLSLLGAIERMTKTLFIGGKVFTVNNNLNLETKGGVNIYPYIQKTLPILIATEPGSGIFEASMNLALPKVNPAKLNVDFPQFIEGERPVATMPLYVKTAESGVTTFPISLLGPSVYKKNESMNLYMQPDSPQFLARGKRLSGSPTVKQNSNFDLVTVGKATSSGTMDLVITSVKASGNWNTTLYSQGFRTTD